MELRNRLERGDRAAAATRPWCSTTRRPAELAAHLRDKLVPPDRPATATAPGDGDAGPEPVARRSDAAQLGSATVEEIFDLIDSELGRAARSDYQEADAR